MRGKSSEPFRRHVSQLINGDAQVNVGMANRTEPRTVSQWIKYIVVAAIAIWLVIWLLRVYVL